MRKPARQAKPVQESQTEMCQVVLPNDANPLGTVLGGTVMHWVDLAAAMAAHRHSSSYVVTASVDHMDFLCPIRIGEVAVLRASVNRVFRTSMEVGVKVFREENFTGLREHASSAYLTFVALDEHGRPHTVAPAIPKTTEEKRRYREAGRRRRWRMEQLGRKPARQREN
jgi:acyl-CoA hydrolase